MAEIQIVYREGYCDCNEAVYNTQCHTMAGEDLGCRMFDNGEVDCNVVPFGDCAHAKFRYIYKGLSVKNYELEELDDPYNPHLNCMVLKTRSKRYYCEKVILDGECIYDELPSNA